MVWFDPFHSQRIFKRKLFNCQDLSTALLYKVDSRQEIMSIESILRWLVASVDNN